MLREACEKWGNRENARGCGCNIILVFTSRFPVLPSSHVIRFLATKLRREHHAHKHLNMHSCASTPAAAAGRGPSSSGFASSCHLSMAKHIRRGHQRKIEEDMFKVLNFDFSDTAAYLPSWTSWQPASAWPASWRRPTQGEGGAKALDRDDKL